MSNILIVVEGQQDVEFLARILETEEFEKKVMLKDLGGEFCRRLIITEFPYQDDLHKRVPNPMFLSNGRKWIAIQPAGSDSELIRRLREALYNLQDSADSLAAVGVIRDADRRSPADQVSALRKEIRPLGEIPSFQLEVPTTAGTIAAGTPRLGVYIWPNNEDRGTLDTIVAECGRTVYAELIAGAERYIGGVDIDKLDAKDSRLIKKPAGKTKAVVACAASILKPGMTIATSIDQNRWLNEESLKLPRVAAMVQFLRDLCGLN